MRVLPPHHDLDERVQIAQPGDGGHLDPAPDLWPGAFQSDPDPVGPVCQTSGRHLRSLLPVVVCALTSYRLRVLREAVSLRSAASREAMGKDDTGHDSAMRWKSAWRPTTPSVEEGTRTTMLPVLRTDARARPLGSVDGKVRPQTNGRTLPAVAVVLIAVVSGCASVLGSGTEDGLFPDSEVLHEVAEPPLEEHAVPDTVSEAAWTWESPRMVGVEEIFPVPTGAVLRLTDGVVALDPVTGEEVWTFRLPGVETDAAVSPDGSVVAVSADGALVLLDSVTGERSAGEEYGPEGGGGLELAGAGLVADAGMVTATEDAGSGLQVALRPWSGEGGGWTAGPLLCDDGSAGTGVEDGFLTPTGVVVVFGCAGGASAMVSLDFSSGEEQWRLIPEEDYATEFSENRGSDAGTFAVVGQVAVLQNLARERGSVVIDTRTGQVLSDSLPSESEADTVRVLSDGYVVRCAEGTGEGVRAWYELRDFSDEVLKTVPIGNARLDSLLPLEGSLVHLEWRESGQAPELVVFPWGEEEPSARVASPVRVDTADLLSIWRAEEVTGPGAFQAVPGGVLLVEYTRGGFHDRVAGFV